MVDIKEKEQIIIAYYELHERENKIAKKLEVKPSYVTKIIQKDKRYWEEKENRLNDTQKKIKEYKKNWINAKRLSKLEEYDAMMREHNRASDILSNMYKTEMSDIDFVKCNRSAYTYDKNSSGLVLRSKINAGFTAPKKVH